MWLNCDYIHTQVTVTWTTKEKQQTKEIETAGIRTGQVVNEGSKSVLMVIVMELASQA